MNLTRPAPIERLVAPVQAFLRHRLAGAGLLLGAAVAALAWASSPWGDGYDALLHTRAAVTLGPWTLEKTVHHWVNDAVMALFFFVVGLELKREILEGELSTRAKAMLPAACAAGGMLVPAAIYAAVNTGRPSLAGWGIPMATDIAFALGVLALLGERIPAAYKVFLTAVAVADDLGAVLVIALFYTDGLSIPALLGGGLLVGLAVVMNVVGIRHHVAYFVVGLGVWLCFLESGVHATLAALLVAFTIPARTRLDSRGMAQSLDRLVQHYAAQPLPDGYGLLKPYEQDVLHEIEHVVERGTAPLQRLEHALLPLVTLVVLPVFAFANAGVRVQGNPLDLVASPLVLGIVLGLVVGKPVGILAAAWVTVRLGVGELPAGLSFRAVGALGVLGGIGFTMSLFVGGLAFSDPALVDAAKVGTLLASVVAGTAGFLVLRRLRPVPRPPA
ncbi:MAG: Na+/H+ antiporter NhaA [Deltaproteobacteria bacterium]|nr:Na+/H+ antiporter NhaA [Deltaproteobacteria bacterium]